MNTSLWGARLRRGGQGTSGATLGLPASAGYGPWPLCLPMFLVRLWKEQCGCGRVTRKVFVTMQAAHPDIGDSGILWGAAGRAEPPSAFLGQWFQHGRPQVLSQPAEFLVDHPG